MFYLVKMKKGIRNLKPYQVEYCVQKIFYLSNKNNNFNVQVKNLIDSFLRLSILDILIFKSFNLRFLQDSNLRPTA